MLSGCSLPTLHLHGVGSIGFTFAPLVTLTWGSVASCPLHAMWISRRCVSVAMRSLDTSLDGISAVVIGALARAWSVMLMAHSSVTSVTMGASGLVIMLSWTPWREEMNMPDLIKYTPDLPIVNASALPHGLGAKFLVTIRGEGKDLVAKRWSRVLPTVGAGEQIVYFGR